MNGALRLWARCEWRRRWPALVLLAVVVGVAGGAATAAFAGARRTTSAYPRFTRSVHQPNVDVNTASTFTSMDPAALDEVMAVPGVRGATLWAFAAIAPAAYPNYFTLSMVAARGESVQMSKVAGEPFTAPSDLAADEAGVNEVMADLLGVRPGDTVDATSLTAEQWSATLQGVQPGTPAGPTGRFRIRTIGRSNEDITDAPDPGFVVSGAYLAAHPEIGHCVCDLMVLADGASVDRVMTRLREIFPDAEVAPPEDFSGRIADTVRLQHRAWVIIAMVAASAGAVASFQGSRRLLRGLDAEGPARSALGMTPRDQRIGRLVSLAPAAFLGAFGTVPVAYALSPLAPVGLTRKAELHRGARFDAFAIVLGAAGVLVAGLGVFVVATLGTRPTRGTLPGRGPVRGLGSALARGPGRPAIAGVVLGVAGLVAAFTIQRSVDHLLAHPRDYGADYQLSITVDDGTDREAVAATLAADSDLEAIGVGWSTSDSVTAHGPQGTSVVEPFTVERIKGAIDARVTRGRRPDRPDEVAVGRLILDELGAEVGDRITVDTPSGPRDLTVVGESLQPGVDTIGRGFTLTLDGLRAFGEASPAVTVARARPGADIDAIVARHADATLLPVVPPSEVRNIGQLGGLPGRVAVVLALLALLALANTALHTVRQARHPVAVRRALGLTGRQVVVAHLYQGLIIGLTGALVGGLGGFVAGRAIYDRLGTDVGVIAHARFVPATFVAAAATILTSVAASAVAGTLAVRRRPGTVLRAE